MNPSISLVCNASQDGTAGADLVYGAAMNEDGSVVLTGETTGIWDETTSTITESTTDDIVDFAAVKLDTDGTELWRWQVRLLRTPYVPVR